MYHNNKFPLALVLLIFCALTAAQETTVESITKEDLQKHLRIIASDSFEGRMTGSQGIEKAADYIESQLRANNINSLSLNGEYRQNFQLYSSKQYSDETFFQVEMPIDTLRFDSIAFLIPCETSRKIESELVFAGYGFISDDGNYNDFSNIDISGKIVMYMSGKPNGTLSEEYLGYGFNPDEESQKLEYIVKNGAKAVIILIEPISTLDNNSSIAELMSMTSQKMSPDPVSDDAETFQFNVLNNTDADKIFTKAGMSSLKEIRERIDSLNKPESFVFGQTKAILKVEIETVKIPAFNIAAVVEGSSRKLKNEYVLICAHYDHDGIDKNGNVLNGADDNGSGTVGLLEIAEAFSKMTEKPKRSIAFVWFTGEERGILGSNYFVNNSPIPLNKIVTVINLDMIGRTRLASDTIPSLGWGVIEVSDGSKIYIIKGNCSEKLLELNERNCNTYGLATDYSQESFISGSDQYPFYKHEIPVFFYHTGIHSDYHRPADDEDRIDYHIMTRASKAAFSTALELANFRRKVKAKPDIQ